MAKELKELPEQEEKKVSVIIVPNDFPIKNYLDMEGNPVICITEREKAIEEYIRLIQVDETTKESNKILTK